jgi:hypothetical protein
MTDPPTTVRRCPALRKRVRLAYYALDQPTGNAGGTGLVQLRRAHRDERLSTGPSISGPDMWITGCAPVGAALSGARSSRRIGDEGADR